MCPYATPLSTAKAWLERAAQSACSCAPAARISQISCLKAVHPLMSLKQRCIEGPPQLRLCRGLGRRRRALQDKAGAAIQLLIGAHGAHAQRQRPRASLRGCREQQLFELWPPDACTPPASSASLVNSHPAWLDPRCMPVPAAAVLTCIRGMQHCNSGDLNNLVSWPCGSVTPGHDMMMRRLLLAGGT